MITEAERAALKKLLAEMPTINQGNHFDLVEKIYLAGKAAADWMPIATAPKDGTRFLGVFGGSVGFFHWQDFKDGGKSPVGWRDSFINVYREETGPSLWMPIPEIGSD